MSAGGKKKKDSWALFRRIRALDFSIIHKSWQLGSPEKALLLVLTTYADHETGRDIRPSLATLASDLATNRASIVRRRHRLVAAGLIVLDTPDPRRHPGRYASRYRIDFDVVAKLEARMNAFEGEPVAEVSRFETEPDAARTDSDPSRLVDATGLVSTFNRLEIEPLPTKRSSSPVDLPEEVYQPLKSAPSKSDARTAVAAAAFEIVDLGDSFMTSEGAR